MFYEVVFISQEPPARRPCVAGVTPTIECLVVRLAELSVVLHRCFSTYAAECGLDAALVAGMRYLSNVAEGEPVSLPAFTGYIRVTAFRAAQRQKHRDRHIIAISTEAVAADLVAEEIHDKSESIVRWALNSLPERQREAISLRILCGLSIQATADEMGIEKPTVRSYLKVGLARLRELLSDSE